VKVAFLPDGFQQYLDWQQIDRKGLVRLNRLIVECQRHPFDGIGKPEPLKGDYSGWWSRRIDQEHRLVYRVEGDTLFIAQCRFHYHP
jgi:toxin YoeB